MADLPARTSGQREQADPVWEHLHVFNVVSTASALIFLIILPFRLRILRASSIKNIPGRQGMAKAVSPLSARPSVSVRLIPTNIDHWSSSVDLPLVASGPDHHLTFDARGKLSHFSAGIIARCLWFDAAFAPRATAFSEIVGYSNALSSSVNIMRFYQSYHAFRDTLHTGFTYAHFSGFCTCGTFGIGMR
jgi:hypothetical protein